MRADIKYTILTVRLPHAAVARFRALVGKPDFSSLVVIFNGADFLIGDLINVLLAFVLVAAAVYFFVVVPVNAIVARRRRGEAPADPTTKKCGECLSEVPIGACRCAFCTSSLTHSLG